MGQGGRGNLATQAPVRRRLAYLEGYKDSIFSWEAVELSKKVRVGVIGAGGIATGAHIPGYKKILDQVELVAIADVNFDLAKARAAEHGFGRAFASFDEMLKSAELDCVSVCTPNKFHAPATIAALEAGLNVLCEKPPAMSVDEARSMARAAQKAGKHLRYGFHYRFNPNVQAAKRFADAGEFGEIYAGQVNALRRRRIPGWGVFTSKELQGGGPLIDVGVHMLDSALHIMGYPQPTEVTGVTYRKLGTRPGVGEWGAWDWKNYNIEDLAMGMIRFANGATLMLQTSFIANIEPREEFDVRLMGTEAGMRLFPELKFFKEMHGTVVDITPAWSPQVQGHHAEVAAFVGLVAGTGDGGALSTAAEGVKVQQIIEALYQSADAGSAVKIG